MRKAMKLFAAAFAIVVGVYAGRADAAIWYGANLDAQLAQDGTADFGRSGIRFLYSDTYSFTISPGVNSLVAEVTSATNLLSLSMSLLYSDTGNRGDWDTLASVTGPILSYANLAEGYYRLIVAGIGGFLCPGSYQGTLSTVPLPSAALLFGAGILVVGAWSRRYKKK